MAQSTKNDKTLDKSGFRSSELITTLTQLENAIKAWEEVKCDSSEEKKSDKDTPKLAQSLLEKLKRQIDDLSD